MKEKVSLLTSTSWSGPVASDDVGHIGIRCLTRVVWPHVTNLLDLRYFCHHNPLFYHLNLLPCHYWSWQRNIYFLVNIFVRHTFSMSKSSIKTKTVSKMTDITESTDGYKVTVKISLCICVVLSWDELKVRQNLLASGYEIYMVCLLVATVYWRKSPQFVKKSNTLTLFIYDFIKPTSCFDYYVTLGYYFLPGAQVLRFPLPHLYHKLVTQ